MRERNAEKQNQVFTSHPAQNLVEKAGDMVQLIGTGNEFLDSALVSTGITSRAEKWDLIKLKNVCTL